MEFLGFLLTRRGIKAKLNKFQAIIHMQNPSNIKEVQQLTRRLAALSRFLSCAGDKAFSFFASIKKKENFEWMPECEDAFSRIKYILSILFLYLSISDNAMSSMLVEDSDSGEKPIYFIIKSFEELNSGITRLNALPSP